MAAPNGLDRLGPYRLLHELGSGAMGTVYLAEDAEDGREIALKVLHPHLLDREGFFQRFEREALAGERVDHPNVVRTLECGVQISDETAYCVLAMEYVPGRTLRALLQEWGTVPEAFVREIASQVAGGLGAIHGAGIVHRDIKPENVLITEDHQVRIMDLGVARHTDLSTALTKDGQFAGSLLYAAPEQFGRGTVGPATDLYALGVLLYELVSGANPFFYEEPARVLNAHLNETPVALTVRNEDVSLFFSELVNTLLAKDPTRRFASASALAETLAQGERSEWWHEREREIGAERALRPRVPVRRETTLCGREEDLARLHAIAGPALAGAGGAVLLHGEAGIGKSRLLDAFLEAMPVAEVQVLYGSFAPSGGLDGVSEGILQRLGRGDLEAALRVHLERTSRLVPAFAATLRREPLPEGTETLRGDVVATLCIHLMRALAAERPLIWIVEDLHFADRDALDLVRALARGVGGHPILVLLTTRPGTARDTLARMEADDSLQSIDLRRLGARDVILLLRDALRNERLVEKLAPKIAVRSDGVPFFVFEMIRGLKDGQFLVQQLDGSYIESQVIEDIEVPASVRSLIEARLEDVTREERAVLDLASVVGFEFDPGLVAAARETPPVAVLEALGHLERRRGVVRVSGRGFRFDHHQFQEVVYGAISDALKREYHHLIAVELEDGRADRQTDAAQTAERVAHHYLRGREPERAAPHVRPALEILQQEGRNAALVDLASEALRQPGVLQGAARCGALMMACTSWDSMGSRDEARRAAEEAIRIASELKDGHLEAESNISLAMHLERVGQLDEAEPLARRALEIAADIGDVPTEARAWLGLSTLAWRRSRLPEAYAHLDRAETLARREESALRPGSIAHGRGLLLSAEGRNEEAYQEYLRALRAVRSDGTVLEEVTLLGNLGSTCLDLRRLDEAEDWLDQQLHLAQASAARGMEALALGHLGLLEVQRGRDERAREHLERQLEIARDVEDGYSERMALSGLSGLAHRAGFHAEARALTDRFLTLVRATGHAAGEAFALGQLAGLADVSGDLEAAIDLHGQALSIQRRIGEMNKAAWSLSCLGSAEARLGLGAAKAHLEEALALAGTLSLPDLRLLALAEYARVTPETASDAAAEIQRHGDRLPPAAHMEVWFTLWQTTGAHSHLESAWRQLQAVVEAAPPEARTSLLDNAWPHRGIVEAWEAHGGGEPSDTADST